MSNMPFKLLENAMQDTQGKYEAAGEAKHLTSMRLNDILLLDGFRYFKLQKKYKTK
jgi:hypothetical protein